MIVLQKRESMVKQSLLTAGLNTQGTLLKLLQQADMLLCWAVYWQVFQRALVRQKFSKAVALKCIVVWVQFLQWKKDQVIATSKKIIKSLFLKVLRDVCHTKDH